MLGPLLEVEMSNKCTPLWCEAHFVVKSAKNAGYGTFGRSDVVSPGRRKGLLTLSKVSKTWGFCSSFKKMMAGMGHMQRIWQDACRVAGTVQETCSSELLGGQGADFLRWVAFWSIRSWGLLRWFCVTGAALRMIWHQFFVWQAQHFRQMEWKNRKTHWYEEEVSQNCFVFDIVNFENWWSLAELSRFGCCQLQKLRKSRRIVSFLTLSSSKTENLAE